MTTDRHSNLLSGDGDKAMGAWRLSSHSPAIVISAGAVAVKDKLSVGEFSLDYDRLMADIKANPDAAEYEYRKLTPMTLGKALNENRLAELGDMVEIVKIVDVTLAQKRDYIESPRSGKELLEGKFKSVPWDISQVRKLADLVE